MTRRRLAWVILAAWFITLGWLVQRQISRSTGARLAEAALAIPPGATYFRLSLGNAPIGFASTTLDTLADSLRVDDQMVLDAPALGRVHRTTTRSTAILSRTLRLRSLTVAFDGDDGRFDARGTVVGDTAWRLDLITAQDSDVARVPLAPTAVLPSVLALRLAFGGELRVGKHYAMRVFDPISLSERDAAFEVRAETTLIVSDSAAYDSAAQTWIPVLWDTVPSFRLDALEGVSRRVWIDDKGQLVRSEDPGGLVWERTAFEIAYENFRNRDTAATARATTAPKRGAIVPTTALIAKVALEPGVRPTLFRVRASAVDLSGLDLDAPGQVVHGDTITVRVPEPSVLTARFGLPALDSGLTIWLRPEPLIQSNDARIEAQARQIIGRERIAGRAMQRLLDYTGSLRRATTPRVPSAIRVLEARAGDCNELTVLFVALARAVGLPARPVAGLLWRDGRFYYHAWAEVYLGDWVAVDPMLGEIADPSRVRLTNGLARHVDLLRLIGNLTLEPL